MLTLPLRRRRGDDGSACRPCRRAGRLHPAARAGMGLLGMGNGAVFQLVPQRFPKEIGVITGIVGAAGGSAASSCRTSSAA